MTDSAHFRALTCYLEDEAATVALGHALAHAARTVQPPLIVYLNGDLGSGKTTLARALLRALGVTGRIKSPTYTLVESYVVPWDAETTGVEIRQNLSLYCYHFDFYRFADPREWLEAGFREYFDDHALCLVEWPEKAAGAGLPQADLSIDLELQGNGRSATIRSWTETGLACLNGVNFSRPE